MKLEISRDSNVWIEPFTALVGDGKLPGGRHIGGPILPEWDSVTAQRHHVNRTPVDKIPARTIDEADLPILKSALWCGPITSHFGHQIAEFSTRIPVYLNLHQQNMPLLFGVGPQKTYHSMPVFMQQLLHWYQIPKENILLCNSPIKVSHLYTAAQQEQLVDIPPSQDYVDFLTSHSERRLDYPVSRGRSIFVS